MNPNTFGLLTQPSSIAGYGLIFTGIQSLLIEDWVRGVGQVLLGIGAVLVPEGSKQK